MNTDDRAIVAAAEERDRAATIRVIASQPYVTELLGDRRDLLRIVRDLEALLKERDTQAEDAADDAAAAEATKGRWR